MVQRQRLIAALLAGVMLLSAVTACSEGSTNAAE